MALSKEQMREYMKKRRAKEKEDQPTMTDEPHPVYPELRKYSDRTYDKKGLVLFTQRCPACKGTWAASIEIECPYCKKAKGEKLAA